MFFFFTSFSSFYRGNQDYQTRACGLTLMQVAPALDGLMEHQHLIKFAKTGNRTNMEETKIVPKSTEEGVMLEIWTTDSSKKSYYVKEAYWFTLISPMAI